jgi:hypothetical protein
VEDTSGEARDSRHLEFTEHMWANDCSVCGAMGGRHDTCAHIQREPKVAAAMLEPSDVASSHAAELIERG